MPNESKKIVVIALVVGFLSGLLGGTLTNEYLIGYLFSQFGGAQSEEPIVKRVVEERVYVEDSKSIDSVKTVQPAVVSVVASSDLPVYRSRSFQFSDPFSDDVFEVPQPDEQNGTVRRQISGGTGFIVTNDGLVMTNKHVVSDKDAEFTVVLSNGTEYEAEIVATDPLNDIGILRILTDKNDRVRETFPIAEFDDSNEIQVGQKVLAIGNSLAEYENTVTAGIISATGRTIVASDSFGRNASSLSGLIQTDAAINQGNSGGPLINLGGRVVGMNTAVAQSANGIAFAIPVNELKFVLESVLRNGRVVRPIVGVRHVILTPESAKEFGVDTEHGALLVPGEFGDPAVLPGSPAEDAGLKAGDVILEINGKDVNVDNTLQNMIQKHQVGDTLNLKVWRGGDVFDLELKLGEAK